MKNLITVFLLFATFVAASAQTAVTDSSLVAWYPFSGNADDASGHNNHATKEGVNKEKDVDGTSNGSFRWNDDDDRIVVPIDINVSAMPSATLCAWVYVQSLAEAVTVISNDDRGGDRKIYTAKGGNNRYVWAISDGKGGFIGDVPVKRRKWTFVAAVYNDDKKTATIYVDGKPTSGKTQMDMGADQTFIGANAYGGDDMETLIDEVRIYNRALAATEIEALMQLKSVPEAPDKISKESYYYLVVPNSLIVRSKPTAAAAKLGTLAQNDTLRSQKQVPEKGKKYNEWLEIKHEGKKAYVQLKYLDKRTVEDDNKSEYERFMDENMRWDGWVFWVVIVVLLVVAVAGTFGFGSVDALLGSFSGSTYENIALLPIATGFAAFFLAFFMVFWQDTVEYYLFSNFSFWPYGYGFITWLLWILVIFVVAVALFTVWESFANAGIVHGLLRIVVQLILSVMIFIPVLIITMALIVIAIILMVLMGFLSASTARRYIIVREY